jgi:gliding-associated putative ABC transporter substrate-binding component GldG
MVHYEGRSVPVNLYPGTKAIITPPELNNAEALLEYKFADAIQKAVDNKIPLLAYSVGNGEPAGANTYDLVENVMKKNYQVFTIDIKTEPVIPDTFQALLIVKPSIAFDDLEKLKIDQYIMNGGKVIWMLDRLEAEMDSLQIKSQVVAYDRNLQLEDLLFKYGVRINADLVMDLQSDFLPFDVSGNQQYEFLHWNYFPLFESPQNHPINKNLGLVAGKFVNSIDTVAAPAIAKHILLQSSSNARTLQTPALISPSENRNVPVDAAFTTANIPIAVLLEGKFTSFYKNRISRSMMDSLAAYGLPFLSESITPGKMIVVSDGDIVLNGVVQNQPLPMGVNPFTLETQYQYQFANRQFIENCLEYLVSNENLSAARSKDYTLRLLDPEKSRSQQTMWQMINLLVPVILLAIFGILYQVWRKRKYKM